ncbi:MAG: hypothetical protein WC227_04200 [Patescibacteria group bacterium]|jgi:hypothetical protein
MLKINLHEVNLLAQMCLDSYEGYTPGQLLTAMLFHEPIEHVRLKDRCEIDALGVVKLSDRGSELLSAKTCVSNWMERPKKLEEMIRDEYHYSMTERQRQLWSRRIGPQPHYDQYYKK